MTRTRRGRHGGRRPGAGRKPLPEGERIEGHWVGLTAEQWEWVALWGPEGANPSECMRELLERAQKFWPAGPARFR